MGKILSDLKLTVVAGIVIALAVAFGVPHIGGGTEAGYGAVSQSYMAFMIRYAHVLAGVMWIGLLWYFNFVQIPTMPKIPDEQKGAISGHIAPEALFWFRWAALLTILFGLALAHINGYLVPALTLSAEPVQFRILGVAMWFGLIMAFNVWFIIWPNQQIALGLNGKEGDKAAAGRKAMLASRTNTMLSIPMLYGMVLAQNSGFLYM